MWITSKNRINTSTGRDLGMLFPKEPKKKKRKRKTTSIMQEKDRTCYLCRKLNGDLSRKRDIHEHHVFGGTANRKLSEQYGLKVYLCPDHHLTGPDAVHRNTRTMTMIRKDGQEAFVRHYPELDFVELFGKSYL